MLLLCNLTAVVMLFLAPRRDTDYQDSTLCVATEVERSSSQQPSLSLQITLQYIAETFQEVHTRNNEGTKLLLFFGFWLLAKMQLFSRYVT